MTAEFPLIVTLADAAHGRTITVEACAGTREAIARRLGLLALDRFSLVAEIRAIAGGIGARGEVSADVVQACAATDLPVPATIAEPFRSEEHTSELQSLMRISYAVFCLKKKNNCTQLTPPQKLHIRI